MTAESTVTGIISNAQTTAASAQGSALDQAFYMQNSRIALVSDTLKPDDIDWTEFDFALEDYGYVPGDASTIWKNLYDSLTAGATGAMDAQIEAWIDKYAPLPDPALMTAQDAYLLGVLNGTLPIGLPAHVVAAMWSQSRDREYADGLTNENKAYSGMAARGFSMPTGTLAAQLAEAQQITQFKLSDNNRAITVEQAKIAVEVQKFAVGEITKLRLSMGQTLSALVNAWVNMYKAPLEAATAVVQAQAAMAQVLATYVNANSARINALSRIEIHNKDVQEENYKIERVENLEEYKSMVDGYARNADAFARIAASAMAAQHSMGSITSSENKQL